MWIDIAERDEEHQKNESGLKHLHRAVSRSMERVEPRDVDKQEITGYAGKNRYYKRPVS